MSRSRHLPSLAVAALIAVACSSPATSPSGSPASPGPSNGPSSSPSASPSPSQASDAIEHPTGATDIVLRYDETGGFVMPAFLASRVPYFTLYGDGTVVFQQMTDQGPIELPDGAFANRPLRVARMDEAQIQQLLRYALTEGGLGIARPNYESGGIADATTAVFDLNAGGLKKTVSVYALGIDPGPNTPAGDVVARAAFQRLAERLRDFDQGGTVPTDVYVPGSFRGILMESGPVQGVPLVKWPWKDLKPADFAAPADPNNPGFPTHIVTKDHVIALGVPAGSVDGGIQNVFVKGPDGKTYSFAARPLLPGEAS
jgi:hypothetical protein